MGVMSHPEQRLAAIERARRTMAEHAPLAGHTGLSPLIERSWQRCIDRGMVPDEAVAFEPVTGSVQRLATERNRALVNAARPVIRALSRAVLHTRYFALLTDEQGMVIDIHGLVDTQNPYTAAIARLGVNLAEAKVGTTAIGACLTDREPIWLHRGEHFFRDTSVFSCAGAPIWGPQGQCVGMLDLTGVMVEEQPALKHLVTQAARSIENALTLAVSHTLLLRMNWPGRLLGEEDDGLVCVDADGRVVGMNRAATHMLGLPSGEVGGHCSQFFAVPADQLFDMAKDSRSATDVPLWSGLRLQIRAMRHTPSGLAVRADVPLKAVESAMIRKAVDDAQGNVQAAARSLGISRATVYRKLGKSGR